MKPGKPLEVIDLFAGPGGWDVGARALGLDPLGIEWDDAACKTRAAAGLRTIHADVALTDPFVAGELVGLIASPPCQAFSTAGKRIGSTLDAEVLDVAVERIASGLYDTADLADDARGATTWQDAAARCADARSALVLEPLRWSIAHLPTLRWVALEQVPPVLPLWRRFAMMYRGWGFHVWTGLVNSADYGVPQTRVRALLLASRDRKPHRPEPTHGDPRRSLPMFVKPWVSMAEALGWGFEERGSPTVTGGGAATGGPEPFGRWARQSLERANARRAGRDDGR